MNDHDNSAAHTAPTAYAQRPEGRPPATKRRKPKTVEEQLAEALARARALKEKVAEQRDRQRISLVEDLYKRYDIDEIADDPAERQRIAALRRELGLES